MPALPWTSVFADPDPESLLRALGERLGFGALAATDGITRSGLGVPDEVTAVWLAAGPGTTRLLLARVDGDQPLREAVARLASRLHRKAPHLLWLVAAADRVRGVMIAAWSLDVGPGIRIAALTVGAEGLQRSDLETLDALVGALDGDSDVEIHARWTEILGREAISRRFFQALEHLVHRLGMNAEGRASPAARREVALTSVSRLLFLAFLEHRGWLNGDPRFLSRCYDTCVGTGGRFQRRVLDPLFFGTLNTPPSRRAARARALGRLPFLNGGLFTRAPVERVHRELVMRDEDFGAVVDQLLLRYRFTPREQTDGWQEAAIDPEILGRAFESLMAPADRRSTGTFYTPLSLVARATDRALEAMVAGVGLDAGLIERVTAGSPVPADDAAAMRGALGSLRLLDPACGSGAFLVHAVDRLTQLRQPCGDRRPAAALRREIVTRSIFGVDVNPTAVWLCELRLWLSMAIDHPATDPADVPPLPNLDHNIRCGDTLLGGDFSVSAGAGGDGRAALLRARYARSTGARKRSLARALDALERGSLVAWIDGRLGQVAAQRRSLVAAARGKDLFGRRRGVIAGERDEARALRQVARELRARRRAAVAGAALPFVFAAHFPEVARAGGFDVVLGNPPWIRVHHIPATMRETLRREFRVYRDAAWTDGARLARAGAGFGAQVDAASLFIERSLALVREGGAVALLVPAKLWKSLAGGGTRRLIMERASLVALEDWSAAPALFDAATYPSLVVARRLVNAATAPSIVVHRGRVEIAWRADRNALPLDDTAGAPWLTVPPAARSAFDRLTRSGVALANAGLGVTTLGVKCGCNDAFVVRASRLRAGIEVTDGVRTAVVEPEFVRPLLRGEAVCPWVAPPPDGYLVFPHGVDGRVIPRLTPGLRDWLLPRRARLEARTDLRGHRAWWSLFRIDGARFDRPRVVWADLGRRLEALVLDRGDRTVPLNTCYVVATRDLTDAFTLAALLNSPVADAWIGAIAEPARGGYRRHFAWSMARLPVPDDWARAREVLAPIGERAVQGTPPDREELLRATLETFRLGRRTVAPLLEWILG